uniref:Jacalin-type lectin domain-containing protein n=1 Tax=Lactuca sativa TaxID=4236 RepID=A0A9R1XX13_LACSA|nr:hypothetical protein LSAT_V11C100007970 [Lactuca sativa]
MKFEENGGTRSNEGCITLGPWGGSQGEDWVIMPEAGGFLKKITIVHAGVIDRIRFQSDCQTGKTETSIFGGDGGNKTDMILIDYPDEYLTNISGTIGQFGGSTVVMSLCFRTNQIRYGPYGNSDKGIPFSYDGKDGMIVGFYGRAGKYIDSIGIYVIPKSLALYPKSSHGVRSIVSEFDCRLFSAFSLCCKMSALGMASGAGPWGAAGGRPWDDGVFSHVKQIRVYLGESLKVICGVQFKYVKKDGKSVLSQMHGGTRGDKTELVDFDDEKEYLTGISGFYRPVEVNGITSISFHTNKKIYGPYGQERGKGSVDYTSKSSPGKVVGFHGRNGDFLIAIGVHMEYF